MDLIFSPLVPFEPISAKVIPSGEQWIAQMKWDGVRMLTYYDGKQVKLFNRRLNERTLQYPELLKPVEYCRSSSFIIDGELIAFDESKPSFHEIMKRDSLRKVQNMQLAVGRTPVTYMVFDVLFSEGAWVTDRSLLERQEILNSTIIAQDHIQIVQSYSNASQLLEVMKAHQMEGIVCKNKMSTYAISGKDNRWQKFKIFYDLHAVIGGVTMENHSLRSLLLGLYDKAGKLIYIGHAGLGKLSSKEITSLSQQLIPTIMAIMPFHNTPDRHKEALWIAPRIVVKVQYMEWTPNRTMRHPTVQAIMKETNAADCTFKQLD